MRRPSMETIYHMSGADDRGDSAEGGRKPLLPMMKVREIFCARIMMRALCRVKVSDRILLFML